MILQVICRGDLYLFLEYIQVDVPISKSMEPQKGWYHKSTRLEDLYDLKPAAVLDLRDTSLLRKKLQRLHSWKLISQWKFSIFNMKYIFKLFFFYCHVSFQGVKTSKNNFALHENRGWLGIHRRSFPVPCRCRRFWRFCRQRKPGEHGDFYRLTPSSESSRLEMDAPTPWWNWSWRHYVPWLYQQKHLEKIEYKHQKGGKLSVCTKVPQFSGAMYVQERLYPQLHLGEPC